MYYSFADLDLIISYALKVLLSEKKINKNTALHKTLASEQMSIFKEPDFRLSTALKKVLLCSK